MGTTDSSFIPAKESKWFIAIFDLYVRNLFRRRFKSIALDQQYFPANESQTIYYLNHTSWWDGIIPLLLNQKVLKQKARAMMEDKQMREHTFFRKIGAFSVNLENPRSAIHSLRYAVDSMKRPHSSLFIYPEGRIVPFSSKKPSFKPGLGWIVKQSPQVDVVPIGIYFHMARHDKPELFIRIGNAVSVDHSNNAEQLNDLFEQTMGKLLKGLQNDSHKTPEQFHSI